jgi:superfamily II DNA/RNA helicase
LIFVKTIEHGALLFNYLVRKGGRQIQAQLLTYHSELSIADRQHTIDLFAAGQCKILITTDAMMVGLDMKDIIFVINLGIADSLENLVQRWGRAGRGYGKRGCYFVTIHS